ncbi:MAG: HlyD family efflux transporter periplasmic adaptor subunit [Muribaculaceae bacterium]|nr:HlyD family efflux transporter periplasmic adaptor subunit [Muribaculaceae bacterium]
MKKILYLAILTCTLLSCKKKEEYNATGIFEATTVTVSAETAGNIVSMPLIEGDSVTLGQYIAIIDTTMFAIQIKQLQSQQKSAVSSTPDISAQAAALRVQIAHQQQECERFGRLLEDGATTQKIYDDAVAYLNTLKGQLEALLSTLNNSKNTIRDNSDAITYQADQIREQIEKCHIISPLSGTILTKYAEQGEYATPGKPLYKIANLDNIYLRCYFTASQLADIRIGEKVTVIADFGGDQQFEYPGIITWIAEESEFTPKSIQTNDSRANLVYAAKVAVKNDGRLKIGQYGEVRL